MLSKIGKRLSRQQVLGGSRSHSSRVSRHDTIRIEIRTLYLGTLCFETIVADLVPEFGWHGTIVPCGTVWESRGRTRRGCWKKLSNGQIKSTHSTAVRSGSGRDREHLSQRHSGCLHRIFLLVKAGRASATPPRVPGTAALSEFFVLTHAGCDGRRMISIKAVRSPWHLE
jgi:hypothetical protein